MALLESIFAGIWALCLVGVACELSQRFCNAFIEVGDAVDQIDWYLLDNKLQRTLLPIMMYTQEPVIVKFFGNLSCSREQFQKVNHLA